MVDGGMGAFSEAFTEVVTEAFTKASKKGDYFDCLWLAQMPLYISTYQHIAMLSNI